MAGSRVHVAGAVLASLLFLTSAAAVAAPPGFGAATPGGAGGAVVRVTTLDDAGPGSLREALGAGNRTVVFDVAGDIVLREPLYVRGAYVTIDGFTAPAPGITLRGWGLIVRGTRGAHDVIVRGLRVRGAAIDGIQVSYGAYNVLIDHVSVAGSGDGNIDITEGSRDVTVAWSILAGTAKSMLIKYGASRVTLHHNIFIGNASRNPQARIDDAGGRAARTTLDMRHNLVWDASSYGTLIWEGAWANVAHNYYGASRKAITVDTARAWVYGNRADGRALDHAGTESAPFDAPPVGGGDACSSAQAALDGAGVRPLDSLDQEWLATVDLGDCPGLLPVPAAPPVVLLPPGPGDEPPDDGTDAPSASPPTGGGGRSAEVTVASGTDDADEDVQVVAFRFAGVPVPAGSRIRSAVLWMFSHRDGARPVALRYSGEAAAGSAPLAPDRYDLSRRPRTRAVVADTPGPWPPYAHAPSPELADIVQEIVDLPGWAPGNSLTVFVDGDGPPSRRPVAAFENGADPGTAAVLVIRWDE
jgi:pectate lyase